MLHDADAIDDATMLGFARETSLSETTFVQSPTQPGADFRNRIWTVGGEIPFAGHPSLGTAVAVAHQRGDAEADYVQETLSGLQPIHVELSGERARASMLQNPAQLGRRMDRADVAAAAGLRVADMHPELAPQVVSTGQPHLMAPVRDPEALDRALPAFARFMALMHVAQAMVLYLVACDGDSGKAYARGFFGYPGVVQEDAATGSAAGPLCAYLHEHIGISAVDIEQGVAMGRPSRLHTEIEDDRVRVGGDVVVLATGTLLV